MKAPPIPTNKVKLLILKLLDNGAWVDSKTLLKATDQKYFDRRIRELRDELGYDIETAIRDGQHHYRLKSKTRNPIKPRTYLGAKEKKKLLLESPPECAICGKGFTEQSKPVLDHRKPLSRGGSGTVANFQLLCVDCNNQKRSQCRGCKINCSSCYLAFPNKFPKAVLIRPPNSKAWEKLKEESTQNGTTIEDLLIALIERHYK